MHITKINVGWLPPLRGVVFDFDEQVNLFIGSNASGKSTILRAIKAIHSLALGEATPPTKFGEAVNIVNVPPGKTDVGDLYIWHEIEEEGPLITISTSNDWPRDSSGTKLDEVPFLYIPATRISLPGTHVFGQEIEGPGDIKIDDLLEKFAVKTESDVRINLNGFLKHAVNAESSLFDARRIKLAIDQLANFMSYSGRSLQNQFEKAIQAGYNCASSICAEVVTGFAPHPYVNWEDPVTHYYMGVGTSDRTPDTLYAGALSSGTQGTLLWIYALALQMASHYSWTEGWEKKPAILLIDEIENHLHPTWQRRVIPALLDHFPGLQIFATTHSPFVVAGLKAGQVHLLERDENGVVTATTKMEDIVGWTADEILRNMMGVDEPTDQLTVDRANRLKQLRDKERLTDEEESELNELRRQVNEDLLSKGGPLEAQRERYGELMEQFLRSRQSELSQDGD